MIALSTRDASLATTMTGSLYKAGASPPDLFKNALVPFDFRILSPKFTYISPPGPINNLQYIVKDPKMTVPLGIFTITDTDIGIL